MYCFFRNYKPLLPGEKIEVAFLFQAATVWASWESVYKTLKENELFNVRLFLVHETSIEVSHNLGSEEYLINNKIPYEKWNKTNCDTYKPHIVFIQFPYDAAFHAPGMMSLNFVKKGARVIYIPYGIEISDSERARKDHFSSRVVENAWRIYTSSNELKKEYIKYCRNRKAVRVTGSPKFDCIFLKNLYPISDNIRKMAGNRKIIVWKLHFPKKIKINEKKYLVTPDIQDYFCFTENIEKYDDLFFIVLPHPKLIGTMVESDLLGDETLALKSLELLSVIQKKRNVFIDKSVDYRNSLYSADAIITDRSSIMVEAAILGVPVLYMKNANYDEPLTEPVYKLMSTCNQGTTWVDMLNFLDAFNHTDLVDHKRREKIINEVFPFIDGKSGLRIVEDIYNSIIEKQEKNFRIIIYGAGEVAGYYFDKQNWNNSFDFDIVAIVDSDINRQGQYLGKYQILSPDCIIEMDFDYIVVMAEQYFYEIYNKLIFELYIDTRSVLHLDEFMSLLEDSIGNT